MQNVLDKFNSSLIVPGSILKKTEEESGRERVFNPIISSEYQKKKAIENTSLTGKY